MTQIEPGRFTRAALHNEAGDIELRLSAGGNWQLMILASDDAEWRLACSGDLRAGAIAPDAPPSTQPIRLGKLHIDPEARRVVVNDSDVCLSAREYKLLLKLAASPNRIFTVEELMRSVWGHEVVRSTRTLLSHTSRLRNKLRRAGADGFVVNCHGVGYRLWEGAELAAAEDRQVA